MKWVKACVLALLGIFISIHLVSLASSDDEIPHPSTYLLTLGEILKHKNRYDDPRPYLKTFGMKQVLPPELYEKLSYDIGEMKDSWAKVVGFRSPDVVGKIAPEIKPGGPPHAGNIPEFEIIPTRQYYYALPIADTTKRNSGKTKLDEDGYIKWETWEGGYPFPQPSGKFKAQQIMYNVEKRYLAFGLNYYLLGWVHGYTKDLKLDFKGSYDVSHLRLAGRCLRPPYGWFDQRAKKRGEFKQFVLGFLAPRDVAGGAQGALHYLDPNKTDQNMIYMPSLRRIRKMSATDTQDPVMGQDAIYDDNEGFMQKLSPTRYPYKFEILEEREFLLPACSWDGSEYISSQGLEFRNLKFERRPLYVVKLTQQDPYYVYSYRIFYIDKETFNYYHIENYDQKGAFTGRLMQLMASFLKWVHMS